MQIKQENSEREYNDIYLKKFAPRVFPSPLSFFLYIFEDKQEKKSEEFFSSNLRCGLRQAHEGGYPFHMLKAIPGKIQSLLNSIVGVIRGPPWIKTKFVCPNVLVSCWIIFMPKFTSQILWSSGLLCFKLCTTPLAHWAILP